MVAELNYTNFIYIKTKRKWYTISFFVLWVLKIRSKYWIRKTKFVQRRFWSWKLRDIDFRSKAKKHLPSSYYFGKSYLFYLIADYFSCIHLFIFSFQSILNISIYLSNVEYVRDKLKIAIHFRILIRGVNEKRNSR